MTTVHGTDPQCLIWDGVSWSVGEVEWRWKRQLEVWIVEPQRDEQQDGVSWSKGDPR